MGVPAVARVRRGLALVATALLLAVGSPTATAAPDAATALTAPDAAAKAWLLADLGAGSILASKDPNGRYAPASTIKALLAMTVLDNLNPNVAVRATTAHTKVECSCVGLVPGAVYTARQLLDGLLMVSGNDAANLLGDMLGGYRSAITRMTAKAQSVGATSTRAMSPSGLDGPGFETVTTPHDLAASGPPSSPMAEAGPKPLPRRTNCSIAIRVTSPVRPATPIWPATRSSPSPSATAEPWRWC
jgi:D-alanyl-D-alanine carboxypeptidase (penicillin-binding protein 5/6)